MDMRFLSLNLGKNVAYFKNIKYKICDIFRRRSRTPYYMLCMMLG